MARRKKRAANLGRQQPYDTLLKSLIEGQETKLLPHFYAGVEYLEALNIEVLRTPLRADRVYKVRYNEAAHILHLEFESGASEDMAPRMAEYHTYFHHLFRCPVISVIVYPFRCAMATPPLREVSGNWLISYLDFKVLPLWKEKAESYIQKKAVELYALLPTMEGANKKLLDRAIDEMVEYYQENDIRLSHELRWLGILLRRADIVSEEEKVMIEQRLSSYDDLFERDPKMRKFREQSEERGRVEGRADTLRENVVAFVRSRYPDLEVLTKQKVHAIKNPETLNLLFNKLLTVSDENIARSMIELAAA